MSRTGGAPVFDLAARTRCTSAFTVVLPTGNLGSVTAAHCFDDGLGINGRNVYSGSQFYGGTTQGAHDYPNYDMVRIHPSGESFDNKIHTDPCCPVVRTVTGSGNPSVGTFICLSGMTTRATCGIEVMNADQTKCFDGGGCTVHLIRGYRSGDYIARGGDSGGPMYNRSGDNNAIARGLIVGGTGCIIDSTGNTACRTLFGHRISAVTGHLDVTIATS